VKSVFLACVLASLVTGEASATQTPASSASSIEQRLLDDVRREPDSFAAHHALAEFYLQQEKLAAAIPHLERAQAIDPANYANSYDLALAYLETHALDRARTQVQRLLQAKETGELHNLLGEVHARAGDFIGAAGEFQRAAHMAPTEEHLFDWGDNLLRLRAYDDAIDVFRASIKRHPQSARLQVGLGIALYSRGQYEEAVTVFCRASDLAPDDPRPYQFLGEMYGVSPAQAGEITTRLERFVRVQPDNAQAQYYYAMNLWRSGQTGETKADLAKVEAGLRRAVAIDPKMVNGFFQLGVLLSEQQRYADAVEPLRTAVRLQPDLTQAHYRLSQAYQRLGQREEAAKELAIFQKLKAAEASARDPK
jgi:tetratricopeptide (TPR) repeat protein